VESRDSIDTWQLEGVQKRKDGGMGERSSSPQAANGAARVVARRLRRSDLAGLMRLKESAGWNQTAADWERLLELEPEGCFGLERDGAVVASSTALVYGRELAWIGMVLTLPEQRGQGYAQRMMECALEFAERRGVARVGLDATAMGLALYQKFGFAPLTVVERWERPELAGAVPPAAVAEWEPDPALDRAAFGADRSRLLESLAREGAASVPGEGYAMGRAGSQAAYFGPCVARSAEAARQLLGWFLARQAGAAAYWDILADNHAAVALAEAHGFRRVRQLTRMTRQLRPLENAASAGHSLVFATAGFECG
jgi:GNAT superfamily N-acetyltransferase